MTTSARMQLFAWFLQVQTPSRGSGCGSKDYLYAGDTHFQEGQDNTINQIHTLEHKASAASHIH